VWILAVPLLDMGSVMLYRMRHGASPFRPDRLHLHYILADRGLAVGRTVSCMTTAAIVCGTMGVTFPLLGIPESVMFYAFLALWALTYRWLVVSARARRPLPTALLSLSVEPRTTLDDAPVGRPP
jgi:UDP-GlcNAc:undecaprenyl-phosphate GlcNAc-1-phosphate transferase